MSYVISLGRCLVIIQLLIFARGFLRQIISINKYQPSGKIAPLAFAMENQKSNDLATSLQTAVEYHKNGEIDQALQAYENIIPSLTGTLKASICGNAGALYMSKGEYEKALGQFELSIEETPDNAQSHYNIAILLTSKLGNHRKALKHCKKSIKLDSQNHKSLHLMANILQNLGQPEEAERYFVMAENLAIQSSTAEDLSLKSIEDTLSKIESMKMKKGDSITKTLDGKDYTLSCVSATPLVLEVKGLLSKEECDHIITSAEGSMEASFIMGGGGGSTKTQFEVSADGSVDQTLYRSSYNAWLHPDEVLLKIQKRLSELLGIPLPYLQQKSEELQAVRYPFGGQFKAHHDSSTFQKRLLTALLYLNSIPHDDAELTTDESTVEGGETWFPFVGSTESTLSTLSVEDGISKTLTEYAEAIESSVDGLKKLTGLKTKPVRGNAVIFFNHLVTGELDPTAVHAGLPVRNKVDCSGDKVKEGDVGIEAEKWIANYWVELDQLLLEEFLSKMNS